MEVRKCKQCGEEFKFRACPTDIDSNRGKYCSEECRRLSRRTLPREIVCERCGKVKLSTKGRVNRFCSHKYVQWRRKVLVRDSRACLECGVDWNGEWGLRSNLNVDHIKPFSELLFSNNIKSLKDAYSCSELWDMANARTLCGDCHRRTENYGFNQYFKLKQIINNR